MGQRVVKTTDWTTKEIDAGTAWFICSVNCPHCEHLNNVKTYIVWDMLHTRTCDKCNKNFKIRFIWPETNKKGDLSL